MKPSAPTCLKKVLAATQNKGLLPGVSDSPAGSQPQTQKNIAALGHPGAVLRCSIILARQTDSPPARDFAKHDRRVLIAGIKQG